MPSDGETGEGSTDVARDYYTSADAVEFYSTIWGGEDIHVGLYDGTDDIREASRRTVDHMAGLLGDLSDKRVLDIGSGYGGGARRIVSEHDAGHVTCLNIAPAENARNRKLTTQQGLDDRIEVVEGSFDDLPFEDASFDVVWSQDAILHAPDRGAVMAEVARVLKPGGEFIFTDPMQADHVPAGADLGPIYDRIHLRNLASFDFYREALTERGFEEMTVEDRSPQLRNHYAQVGRDLDSRRDELSASDAFVDRMLEGLAHWVRGADEGALAWGILLFRKKA